MLWRAIRFLLVASAARPRRVVPRWEPVMSTPQSWLFRGLVAVWAAATITFWLWWFDSAHVVSWIGMLVTSLPVLWATCLPAWFLFFAHRMRQLHPETPIPHGRVAMIVTKTP